MYVNHNPNPTGKHIGDCAVRAISKALGTDWIKAYLSLAVTGLSMYDMPSANWVWGALLKDNGYASQIMPDYCTVKDFCDDHPTGTYVLALSGHVVTVVDGDYYDTWDSGDELVNYYYYREADGNV